MKYIEHFVCKFLIALSWHVQRILQLLPVSSVSGLHLPTSSISHLQIWFGRLILKEVVSSTELFIKPTGQNKPCTPLLKFPLIHPPHLSHSIILALSLLPCFCLQSNMWLFQYDGQLALPPSLPQVGVLTLARWQPTERYYLGALCGPEGLGCICH